MAAYVLQAFFMMFSVVIFGMLIGSKDFIEGDDIFVNIIPMGVLTFVLCFSLLKSGSLAKAVFH
jgi:hypothetical protein